jgi:three-Cys-motif partner protein
MVNNFFAKPFEWSRLKHDILEKYLRVWIYKLASRYPELAFIDTCAGAGIYADGSDGSPLLAVRWNDRADLAAKGSRLIVHAVERNRSDAESLSRALQPWAGRTPPLAFVYATRFEHALPSILSRTRHAPTLVFIDPWGVHTLTAERLRPLLEDKGRAPTELLVRIDPVLFARFAGWLKEIPRDGRGQRTAAAFERLLGELNIDTDGLRDAAAVNPRALSNRMLMFDVYLRMFEERFRYVQIIPIRPSYFAAPKYYLVHCTDSPHGAAKINDMVSTTEDALFQDTIMRESGDQGLLFEPRREPRVRITDAEAFILEMLQSNNEVDFITTSARLALRFGPDLREKHHRQAVRELVRRKRIMQTPMGSLESTTLLKRCQ